MKILQDDVRGISTTTGQVAWPKENAIDMYPKNPFKAIQHTQSDSAIKLSVHNEYGGSNAVYVGGTNATSGSLAVRSFDEVTLHQTVALSFINAPHFTWATQKWVETIASSWADYTERSENLKLILTLATDIVSDFTLTSGGTGYTEGYLSATQNSAEVDGFFGTYTVDESGVIDGCHIVNPGTGGLNSSTYPITLTPSDPGAAGTGANVTAESTLEIGIIRAGYAQEFTNPRYGLKDGLVDYSIKKKYSSGADYYRKRDMVRTYQGSVRLDLTESAQLRSILQQAVQDCFAFNLMDEDEGVVFGKIKALPSSTRITNNHKVMNFKIEELV